jgi:hypothetical protein
MSAGMSCVPVNCVSSASDRVDSAESGRKAAWSFSVTSVSLLDWLPAIGSTTKKPSSTTTAGSSARRRLNPLPRGGEVSGVVERDVSSIGPPGGVGAVAVAGGLRAPAKVIAMGDRSGGPASIGSAATGAEKR